MNRFKQLFSDTLIFAVGNFTTKLLLFVLMPLYTYALTKEEYGVSDLLSNSIELIMPVLTLCISEAIFRFSMDKDIDFRKLFSNGINFILLSSLFLLFLLLVGRFFFNINYWFYFFCLYFSSTFKQLFSQFVRGLGFVKIFAISGVVGAIVLVGVNIISLLWLKTGVEGYLFSYIASNVIVVIYLYLVLGLRRYISVGSFDRKLLISMLTYSLPLIPNLLSWWFANVSSRYVIVLYCGMGVAGGFSAASKMPSIVNMLSSVFQQAWQLSSVKEHSKANPLDFYSKVFKYYSAFILVSCSFIIALTPILSRFLLIGEFYKSWIYTPLLMVSATLGCYSVFFGTFYMVAKKNKMIMLSTLIGAIVNIVVCFVLIPVIGVNGALIANIISYLIIVIMRFIDTKKIANISVEKYKLILGVLLIMVQAVLFTFNTTVTIVLGCAVFLVIVCMNCRSLFDVMKYVLISFNRNKKI